MITKPTLPQLAPPIRKGANGLFKYSEHTCAFGYALCEFIHVEQIILLASAAFLISLIFIFADKILLVFAPVAEAVEDVIV